MITRAVHLSRAFALFLPARGRCFMLLLRVLLAVSWFVIFAGFGALFLFLAPRDPGNDDDPGSPPDPPGGALVQLP